MKKIKEGDRVIALTDPENQDCQQRVKGQVYSVLSVMYCQKCGIQSVYIGGKSQAFTEDIVKCYCGSEQPALGKSWTDSNLFVKVDEQSMQEAVDREEYELAAVIRDNLK